MLIHLIPKFIEKRSVCSRTIGGTRTVKFSNGVTDSFYILEEAMNKFQESFSQIGAAITEITRNAQIKGNNKQAESEIRKTE